MSLTSVGFCRLDPLEHSLVSVLPRRQRDRSPKFNAEDHFERRVILKIKIEIQRFVSLDRSIPTLEQSRKPSSSVHPKDRRLS
jgi:hypothetical protein